MALLKAANGFSTIYSRQKIRMLKEYYFCDSEYSFDHNALHLYVHLSSLFQNDIILFVICICPPVKFHMNELNLI